MKQHAANIATRTGSARLGGVIAFTSLLLGSIAFAQAPAGAPAAAAEETKPSDILVNRPDADVDQNAELLDPVFESKGHGISLRPPKDSVPVRRLGSKDIIEFVHEKNGWDLKVSKIMLPQPGKLAEWRDTQGNMQPGVLEYTVKRLKEEIPDAEILRQDVVNIGDGDVGMIAVRYVKNLKSLLTQQAIIQRTDQLYYLLALTTPGAEKGAKDDQAATSEKLAVEAFRQILDSVKLLDLTAVREDQDARLFRTRGFLVNLAPEKIKKTLQKQQWARVLKNGKDVGYVYSEEGTQLKGAQEGVEIRVRSRMLPSAELQVDAGSIMFTSVDLRHEDWSTLTEYVNLKQQAAKPEEYKAPNLAEFGVADRRSTPGRGDVFNLQVLYESTRERPEPIGRDLPPFYLPQAISHMLPRLIPLGEPKTYMFYIWVPETREVMLRFIDVKEQKKVELGNRVLRAVLVEDRIGLEGPVTTHYLTPTGEWVGSENKDNGITMLASNEEALLNIWKDAILKAPEAPKGKDVQTPKPSEDKDSGTPKE